jgi:hypothetical protein
MALIDKPHWVMGVFAAGLLVLVLALFYGPTDNWNWDPSYYYAQLRSPIIDRDLDFRDETITGSVQTRVTERGLQGSPWPIGPGLLWSPFFLAAHIPLVLFAPGLADGTNFLYIALVSFGSFLFGGLGLFLIYKIGRLFASPRLSVLAAGLSLLATPLAFYLFRQPILAHTTSLFAAGLLVYAYLLLDMEKLPLRGSGLLFGVLLGLNILLRWSSLFFAVLPAAYYAREAVRIRQSSQSTASWRALGRELLIAAAALLLTLSPQMVEWYGLHGRILVIPQGPGSFVAGLLPLHLLDIFFHSNRGVLLWAPFFGIGLIALAWIPVTRYKIVFYSICIMQLILVGYRDDWFSGGLFGQRYLLELLPFLAIGFVCFARRGLPNTGAQVVFGVICAALVVHQLVLVYAVEHAAEPGWIPLAAYLGGEPLGWEVQWQCFLRLARDPGLWLQPRPYVLPERQALVVSLAQSGWNWELARLPLSAMLLAPLLLLAGTGAGQAACSAEAGLAGCRYPGPDVGLGDLPAGTGVSAGGCGRPG